MRTTEELEKAIIADIKNTGYFVIPEEPDLLLDETINDLLKKEIIVWSEQYDDAVVLN